MQFVCAGGKQNANSSDRTERNILVYKVANSSDRTERNILVYKVAKQTDCTKILINILALQMLVFEN